MDIFKRVSEYQAESERLAWTGTFKEYTEQLRNDPSPAMTAHARVYEMIESYGVEEVGGNKSYKFLSKKYSDWIVQWKSWLKNIFTLLPDDLKCANGYCY